MKIDEQNSASTSSVLKHLRETISARAENTSLRNVAREIGMSPTGLKKFLQGTAPYSPTLRRLRAWYVQFAAMNSGDLELRDADAALSVLVHDLTLDSRRRTVDRLISCLTRGYEESGKSPPPWMEELGGGDEPHSLGAEVPHGRPSALGKYRGIIGSSPEYARRKQEDIDLEDRRPAWNTSSTRVR